MPSDRRLHPLSLFFGLGKQASGLVVPLILFLIGSRSAGFGWELVALVFLVPSAIVALGRQLTYRYRYEPGEIVVRSGFLFRNERHVPYGRIQNIEAVQNLAHRLVNVVEVRIQTGGADEPEATMTVLPVAALDEMRQRVAEARRPAARAVPPEEQLAPVIFRLPAGEVLLSGFIENRGLLIVGAALGLLWELGVLPGMLQSALGAEVAGRGALRAAVRGIFAGAWQPGSLLVAAVLVVGFLLLTRVLSMGWALMRLHGFTVVREAADLRIAFGLLTRMTTTIPVRRIQQVTIRQTPLHRVFGRASVRVATAGGTGQDGASRQREWLAPIIRVDEVPRLLEEVLPGVGFTAFQWQPVHPRAFRRAVKVSMAVSLIPCVAMTGFLGWWGLALLPSCLAFAVVQARIAVANLGWARGDKEIAFRRGAFWRYVSIARVTKIQAVSVRESPFDRRAGMATLAVDTAGSSESDQVRIPYLRRDVADRASAELAAEAGTTEFTW